MNDKKPNGKIAAEHLRMLAGRIEEIEPVETNKDNVIRFDFSELRDPSDVNLTKKITDKIGKKFQSIYSFHLSDLKRHLCDFERVNRFYETFENARSVKPKSHAFARINKKPDEEKFGDCFYVGSSRNTDTRLKQHLGLIAKTTYSLQMKHWAANLDGGFEIRVHKFELGEEKLKLLPYLEDQWAWELNPMLGRRGSL